MKDKSALKKLTDEELVSKIIETKSELLFEILYDRYAKIIYNKCYGFTKSEEEAKDLAQEVFLKLFINLGKYHKKVKFSAWFYLFTYNHCINYVNRDLGVKINNNSVRLDDTNLEIESNYLNNNDEDIDAKILNLKIEKLSESLELISKEEKTILLLKYQDEVSIKDLAKMLNIGESAVKMRLKRAKLHLLEVYNSL